MSIPTRARFYKSTGFGSKFLVIPSEAPSSFAFVFSDNWKRQLIRLTAFYIKVSSMLIGILDWFFMLFHMRFQTGTVSYGPLEVKVWGFHCFYFLFACIGLDTTINCRVFIVIVTPHIRCLSAKATNTPQEVFNIYNCPCSFSFIWNYKYYLPYAQI